MKTVQKLWVALLLTAPGVTLAAGTPSFLCTRASGWVEKTICANAALSDLDLELAQVHARLLRLPNPQGRKRIESDQRRWWGTRPACQADPAPEACLTRLYQARISDLKQRPDYPGDHAPAAKTVHLDAHIKSKGPGWTQQLSVYVKAIDRCRSEAGVPVDSVLSAWKEGRGESIALWLRSADQHLFCEADLGGVKLLRLRPHEYGEPLPDSNAALYLGTTAPPGMPAHSCAGQEWQGLRLGRASTLRLIPPQSHQSGHALRGQKFS